jgi:hypothetical protein
VASRFAAEDAIFMLQANDINVIHIKVIGGAPVGVKIVFSQFEAHSLWIIVAFSNVIHRQSKAVRFWKLGGHSLAQIGSEGCDTTLPWGVVTNKGNLVNMMHVNSPHWKLAQKALFFVSGLVLCREEAVISANGYWLPDAGCRIVRSLVYPPV